MKNFIKYILQQFLGFENYLVVFSIFKIKTLSFDKNEKDFLIFLKTINSNGYILDIGANIGIMTSHFSKKFPNSTIIAYEPIPTNLSALKRVVKFFKHKNVIIKETALGNKVGKAQMIMPQNNNVKMQGLSHIIDPNEALEKGTSYEVAITKADNTAELTKLSTPVTGIKVDVENYEYFVLQGCSEIIKRDSPSIYLELWDNENRKNCFSLLEKMNYSPMIVHNKTLIHAKEATHTTQNFIFIPNHIKHQ